MNGQTFTLGYDAEGRVVSVTGPPYNAAFTYNADGQRVRSVINGVTTNFVGPHYEVTGTVITKYYFAGATRVAMRKYSVPSGMAVEYFLSDHLGSTSLTTDSNGNKVSEMRYTAWGEVRYTWTDPNLNTSPIYALTRYTFTGQYSYASDFGLLYYNARWYDSALGRFAQADTIVTGGVQGLDRYAYVNNNPVRYIDPSGHQCVPVEDCYGYSGGGGGGKRITQIDEDFVVFMLTSHVGDVLLATINGENVEFVYAYDDSGRFVLWNANEGKAYEGLSVLEYLSEHDTPSAFWLLQPDGTFRISGVANYPISTLKDIEMIPYPVITSYYANAGMQMGSCNPGSSPASCSYDNGDLYFKRDYDGYAAFKALFGFSTAVASLVTPPPFNLIVLTISGASFYFASEDLMETVHTWEIIDVVYEPGLYPLHIYNP